MCRVKKLLHGTKRKNFFQNSSKSIYCHELSKINEKKRQKKTFFYKNQNLTPFCPKTGKSDFSRKIGLGHF